MVRKFGTKDELEVFLIQSNMDIKKQRVKPEPVEELNKVKLVNGKVTKIGGEIPEQVKKENE